jgi:endonuclease/exonuclease/phosphatase family metal-dependent hydrolase
LLSHHLRGNNFSEFWKQVLRMGVHNLETTMPLRIITFNIRYATTSPTPHEERWEVRRPKLCTQIRFNTAGRCAFVSFQEALANQVDDIQQELGPAWSHIGVGRDDGKAAGEFSPVFYRADTWKCERSKTYWLSPTPEEPSTGWDAVLPRVVTMGMFKHKQNGARVVVLSTHFDHIGVKAREESAKLILKLADSWVGEVSQSGKGKPPVFLGGDFNSTPEDKAYQTMTAPGTGMTDISTLIPEERRYGNVLTYTSFDEPDQEPSRIDFLFVKDTTDISFLTYGVLANRFDDGVFLSDHRAVMADMDIPVRGQPPSAGGSAQGTL